MAAGRAHILIALLVAGCAGPDPTVDGLEPAGTTVPPEVLDCRGDRDGLLERDELPSVPGIVGRQRTTGPVDVSSEGRNVSAEGLVWDMPAGGELVEIRTEAVEDLWFAHAFPGATYALVLDGSAPPSEQVSAVYRVEEDGVLLLGLASRLPDLGLLLPYDEPPVVLRLPVRLGDSWTAVARVTEGTADGLRLVSEDTYEITVDARGTVRTADVAIRDALRVRVLVTSRSPAMEPATALEHIWYRECMGEVARLVAHPGELGPEVTSAAQLRTIAF